MSAPTDAELLLRVATAAGCGLLIGLERQYRSRTAGLRTPTLVAAGAAAFVLTGELNTSSTAPLQITAYVVSGVGFLGGGVILRQGFSVQELTTAATLWCSAAIGCLAATGHLAAAAIVTDMVLGVHLLLRPLGRLVERAPTSGDDDPGAYLLQVDVRRKSAVLRSGTALARGTASQPHADLNPCQKRWTAPPHTRSIGNPDAGQRPPAEERGRRGRRHVTTRGEVGRPPVCRPLDATP